MLRSIGTTNSAICSYDGSETRIWKSPEQNDVTPSAILIDKRGNMLVGKRAYDSAPHSPDNSATLFKRLMGTSTPIHFSAVNLTKSPEECSAELLKVLFGYLPEEIRNDPDTGTVITVPAAFNQMQKDATMQAANMAGIGKIALMQEPVAAIMSVMRVRNTDGIFLIYDLGGGTLDIAIAQSISGRVNLLTHGGIAMCGGRDFDLILINNIVRPWLLENFSLPEDFSVNPVFKKLLRLASWAIERAKIELSAREESIINLSETEVRIKDMNGNDIYFDIPLHRNTYDKLIAEKINDSIDATRETISNAMLTPHDLEQIVFVGGPTNYKPLRDKVSFELGGLRNMYVNPMTAVAEGASLFAESIDWSSINRTRKVVRGQILSGSKLGLTFNYNSRTSDIKSKIVVQITGQIDSGSEFQIDSLETGWTSGRCKLKNGATVEVNLTKAGENIFKVFVFDSVGGLVTLEYDKIIINRTAATIVAIPASHSVSVQALDKLGGRPGLVYLVRKNDLLPKKGKLLFKAATSLKASAPDSYKFNLFEGESDDPKFNRYIGVFKISGTDLSDGVIPAGADLRCDYEILDSGNIILEVSIPCIGGTFSEKNFYSRVEGERDLSSDSLTIIEEGERILNQIEEISKVVDSPKLQKASKKVELAVMLDPDESDIEKNQEAMENVHRAKELLDQVRKEHLKPIRQIDLDKLLSAFDEYARQYARPLEITAIDNLAKTAKRSIDKNDKNFESHLDELNSKIFQILWRQDWFIVEKFKWMISSPHLFTNKNRFDELIRIGKQLMHSDEIEKLRTVVVQLSMIKIRGISDNEIFDMINIIKG